MEEVIQYVPNLYATFWALIPPLVAIILALITKEVYSSLFVGIVIGGLFYGNIFQSGFSFEKSVLHIFEDGLESRDFINVVDIAKGVIAAIDNAKSNSEIINLGSGVGTSVIDIANMLKEIDDEYRTTLMNFAKYHLIMFAMAKIMEMTKEEQNQVALYLFNNISII